MDYWRGNDSDIEEQLALYPRRRWYWPVGGAREGVYRGYDVIVEVYPGGNDMPAYTTFRVDFDQQAIGPPGFRQVRRGFPRRVKEKVGRYRFTARDRDQLADWLSPKRRRTIEKMLDGNWYVKRNWRQLVLHRFSYYASDVSKIQKGLDQLLDTVEVLVSE